MGTRIKISINRWSGIFEIGLSTESNEVLLLSSAIHQTQHVAVVLESTEKEKGGNHQKPGQLWATCGKIDINLHKESVCESKYRILLIFED